MGKSAGFKPIVFAPVTGPQPVARVTFCTAAFRAVFAICCVLVARDARLHARVCHQVLFLVAPFAHARLLVTTCAAWGRLVAESALVLRCVIIALTEAKATRHVLGLVWALGRGRTQVLVVGARLVPLIQTNEALVNQSAAVLDTCSVKVNVLARAKAIFGVIGVLLPKFVRIALTLSRFRIERAFLLITGKARIFVFALGADAFARNALLIAQKPALSTLVTFASFFVTQ